MTISSTYTGEAGAASTPAASGTPALKEWRSVCRSILQGEQIITVRKGGIREEGRRFEVRFDRFALFPTDEHQAAEYLKPAYRRFSESARPADTPEQPSDSPLVIEGFCDVAGVFEISEERYLDAIDSMHIWQKSYISERLKWKPRLPLCVVALRAHLLPAPVGIPLLDEYGGCKSWVELSTEVPLEGEPVLSDVAFGAKLAAVEKALA